MEIYQSGLEAGREDKLAYYESTVKSAAEVTDVMVEAALECADSEFNCLYIGNAEITEMIRRERMRQVLEAARDAKLPIAADVIPEVAEDNAAIDASDKKIGVTDEMVKAGWLAWGKYYDPLRVRKTGEEPMREVLVAALKVMR